MLRQFDDHNLRVLMRRQETEFRIQKDEFENNKAQIAFYLNILAKNSVNSLILFFPEYWLLILE